MLEPTAAVRARSAVGKRHDRNAITLSHRRDVRACRDDVSRELVAEYLGVRGPGQRMRLDRRDNRTRDIFVKVGATDTATGGPNHDLAWAWLLRLADILYPEITSIVKAKRAHYAPQSRRWLRFTITARSGRPADG